MHSGGRGIHGRACVVRGMHSRGGHVWQGACMAGGHVLWEACIVGGIHGRGHAW